ncbi:F-box/WD repeat-containing protein 4-like [Schistocerca serialis cubense]|uniref:F-box/WD repeat-containing protein 4-like n=1 Tax=Schistocerca serialis cubense TaxID=2023355 RepID=UPI00214F1073|nr:F-box/WD repeat-containing protein 4-like [Schistocerca serialis cubense]
MNGQSVLQESEDESRLRLDNLPSDVLYILFQYCDRATLGRLSQCCKQFNDIVTGIWETLSRKLIATNQLNDEICKRSFRTLREWEKCQISKNWTNGRFREVCYFASTTRYMPWLSLSDKVLWLSRGNVIEGYKRTKKGLNVSRALFSLKGHTDDICRFVIHDEIIISGSRDAAICGWSCATGELLFAQTSSHTSNIDAVDCNGVVLITGSRDRTVKLWTAADDYVWEEHVEIDLDDRVWSIAACTDSPACAVGTAGHNEVPPLHIIDLERPEMTASLEGKYKAGAGILDLHWESPHTLLSAGYDTHVRLWDLRTGSNVASWMDPFDAAVYCLATDNLYTILCGTALHGRVQLWDKRHKQSKQIYYMSLRQSSPVYSLSFDPCQLFAAVDRSVHCLDFTSNKNKMINYMNGNFFT